MTLIKKIKAFLLLNNIKYIDVDITNTSTKTKIYLTINFSNVSLFFKASNKDQDKTYRESIIYINEMNKIYTQNPVGKFHVENSDITSNT